MTGPRVLLRAVTRNGRRLGAGSALIVLHQICEALVPVLIGVIVDQAVGPGDLGALVAWTAALAVLFAALTSAYRLGARQLMRAIAEEAHLLRAELAARVLDPRGIRTEHRLGDLLTISTSDADNTSYLLDYVPRVAGAVAATTASAVALLVVDVRLGLAVLAGTPVVLAALQAAGPLITRRAAERQEAAGAAASVAADLVRGVRPLRGLGAEAAAARRYRQVSGHSLRAALRAAAAQGGYLAASTALGALLACGVAVLAGWYALSGRITIGEFITVIGLAQFLMEPFGTLANVPGWIAEARASATRVASVLAAGMLHPAEGPTAGSTGLVVRDLTYGPLKGLSLRADPGEFVGVVARRPGDGEALVTALSGWANPAEWTGELLAGGVPAALARDTLLVEPHHTDLFSGTLAANLAPDQHGFEPGVLAAVAADEVLAAHPDGADRVIAERGADLSGGQRQRIALARALLAAPPVLVLHNPTTAVDAVTEHAIARGVRALRHGTSGRLVTVVVTSSPALLAAADRVIVLDEGRVAAEGVHADLVADLGYAAAVLR